MFNNFDDTTTLQNPMSNMMPQQFGSPITEQEIQNHKNRLNRLITKLINTHNIDEENSVNNEIRNETKFLSSLLNIKRNDLNQNNNMNNNFFNPMINQNNMTNNINNNGMFNNNLIQQQMMQQQQMMAAQVSNQLGMQNILNPPIMDNISSINKPIIPQNDNLWNLFFKFEDKNFTIMIDPNKKFIEAINMFILKIGSIENFIFNYNGKEIIKDRKICQTGLSFGSIINVFTFRGTAPEGFQVIFFEKESIGKTNIPIKIISVSDEKIYSLIEQYIKLVNIYKKRFIFNNKDLNPNLTLAEAGITNNSTISVMNRI